MKIFRNLNKDGKGILGKKVKENPFRNDIAAYSFITYFIPLIIYSFVFNPEMGKSWVSTIYILWYFIGLFMRVRVKSTNKIEIIYNYIILFPFLLSYTITFNIYKNIIKIKYPEMEIELYDRKMKAKQLKYDRKMKLKKLRKIIRHDNRICFVS